MRNQWLPDLSGLVLAIILIFVPIGYGGTEPWAGAVLNQLAGVACLFWAGGLLIQPRWPAVPRGQMVVALLLLMLGWGMTLNARSLHDLDFWEYVPLVQAIDWLPGTLDSRASRDSMLRVAALLGVFMVTCDLCSRRRWRARLIVTMALMGTATAAFGIYQKVSHEPFGIWPVPQPPQTAFATFWYHGNAASFLNITLPLVVGLAIGAFRRGGGQLAKAGWLLAAGIVSVGLLVNVSKAGHAMALILLGGFLAMLVRRLRQIVIRHGWRQPLGLAVIALGAIVAGLITLDSSESIVRWREYLARTGADSRFQVAALGLGLAGKAGWFGFGPGSFDAVFQHHVADIGQTLTVRWKFAHNDYLQTLIEWGWAGMALWICFWLVPLRAALGCIWTETWRPSRARLTACHNELEAGGLDDEDKSSRVSYSLCVGPALALAGVFIHAAFDFPLQIAGIQLYTAVIAGVLTASLRKGTA